MISTQRLIILFILINIVTGIVDLTYYSPTSYQNTPFDDYKNAMDDFQEEAQEEETVWGSLLSGGSQVIETTIVNPLRLGYTLLRFMWKAFVPFSIMPNDNNTFVENAIVTIIMVFRSLLALIAGIEIYMFFKNKKTS